MTTPIATEITRRLEPVVHDPFIDHLRAAGAGPGGQSPAATSARPRP